ncbi:MAG: hypothetical protein LBI42_15215 [Chitinispirillales bacterium]|jgi:hypothetical protein|nr:hypothetical protein [Chitinispirillales bacterium]
MSEDMIHISSGDLSVSLLDPSKDIRKTGSRYCTGCYIWQVLGADGHFLLSGPNFPSENPPPFDGQGMPEVFEIPLGGDDEPVGAEVCVIGVGMVRKTSGIEPFHPRNNPLVTKPCLWDVEQGDGWAVMTTSQSYREKSIKLRREVHVKGKRILSISHVENTGNADVTLRWFCHPFFPLNEDFACGKISPNVILPESSGYQMSADNIIFMKPDYPWKKGHFQVLAAPETKLCFNVPHPIVESIKMETSYNVVRCALWANANTFSFEPFTQCVLKSGEITAWHVMMEI